MSSFFRRRHEPEDITPLPAASECVEVSGLEHLKSLERMEKKAFKFDPNLPIDELSELDAAIATGNAEKGAEITQALNDDNSPYPEVRFSFSLSYIDDWFLSSFVPSALYFALFPHLRLYFFVDMLGAAFPWIATPLSKSSECARVGSRNKGSAMRLLQCAWCENCASPCSNKREKLTKRDRPNNRCEPSSETSMSIYLQIRSALG